MAPELPGYALAVLGVGLGAARALQLFQWTINETGVRDAFVRILKANNLDRADKLCAAGGDVPMIRMVRAVLDANARASARDAASLRAELAAALAAAQREQASRVTALQFVSVTSLAATGFGVVHGVVVARGFGGGLIVLSFVTLGLFGWCLRATYRLLVATPREVGAIVEALVELKTSQ